MNECHVAFDYTSNQVSFIKMYRQFTSKASDRQKFLGL